jgi:PAS domain-containing protein
MNSGTNPGGLASLLSSASLGALLVSCQGAPADPGGGEAPSTNGGSSGISEPTGRCAGGPQAGPSPIRRLTRFEYNATVEALLADHSQPATTFPPEELGNGFGNDATALGASLLLVERYYEAAKQLADAATASERLAEFVGCAAGSADESACAQSFIAQFGARAFRRPLKDDERARFTTLYTSSRSERSFAEAVRDVVWVMLQSPQFLYRVELDGTLLPGGVATLSPYELASRLSYLFWGSMPDQALFDAAAQGQLTTAADVRKQAERLLAEPRARRVVRQFHASLFGLSGLDFLSKSTESYPQFTPELGPLFRRETESFLEHAVWEGDGAFSTLLSGGYTFMNARLAAFYGVTGPNSEAFERVELDPARRAGFLTQAGPMAALTPGSSTNPVIRGAYVRSRLFCDPPPDPPPTLMVMEPEPDPALSTRERFVAHLTDPSCSGCHQLMDPIGFALENLDGLGLWRDMDHGKPVDASGDLPSTDVAGPLKGPAELARRIAQSAQAQGCYAGHWMSFGYGRGFTEQDACTKNAIEGAFSASGGNIKQLLVALTQTDAFMFRTVEAP